MKQAVPLESIIAQGGEREEMYPVIRAAARKRYGRLGPIWEDVAHEAWIIVNDPERRRVAGTRRKWSVKILDEAARNLGIYRMKYTDDKVILAPPREGIPMPCSLGGRKDERIDILGAARDPRLLGVIREVLAAAEQGEDVRIVELARRHGLSYRQLRRVGLAAWAQRGQLGLLEVGDE
ncbi:MAG: hypothetical protein AB1553_05605 [Nitrospirota bacterium]